MNNVSGSDAFNRRGMLAALFWGFLLIGLIWGGIVAASFVWEASWPEADPGYHIPENALYNLGFTDEPHDEISDDGRSAFQAWEDFITVGAVASFLLIRNWVMCWNTQDWRDWMVVSTVAIELCFMALYFYLVVGNLWPAFGGGWIRESIRYILIVNLIVGTAIFVIEDIRRWYWNRQGRGRAEGALYG
jgi:hypothetical protein